MKHNIAIFVSGSGTNCENIVRHFAHHPSIQVALVVSSNPRAGAISRIKPYGIPTLVVDRERLASEAFVQQLRSDFQIDFVVLAGFLMRVPDTLTRAFDHRMVNIHPALLPKYGGKGMYGRHVHEAVKANGEAETGMTIHWVSSVIDGGAIISQFATAIAPTDTVDDIAHKEHELEMAHFPSEIERIITAMDAGQM